MNTDEAAALGAVYQAAYQSKGYKVKKFHIRDANIYPIVADFEKVTSPESGDASAGSMVRRVLFGTLNLFPQKKVLTFNRHTSFGFSVNYGNLDFLDDISFKYHSSAQFSILQFYHSLEL